jgi:hypothetical protein
MTTRAPVVADDYPLPERRVSRLDLVFFFALRPPRGRARDLRKTADQRNAAAPGH